MKHHFLFLLILLFLLLLTVFIIDIPPSLFHWDAIQLFPCWTFPFGTDWLGRDVLQQTVQGVVQSMRVGITASLISGLMALILGLLAGVFKGSFGLIITFIIDIFFALPHLVLLILISFIFGGGFRGTVLAIGLTHWPALARIIRAEVIQIQKAPYIHVSQKLGKSLLWRVFHHYPPLLAPQFFVGLLLLFPKSMLHEAGLTFLGFGLPPHHPTVGTILAETLPYLPAGIWWPAFFPGLTLVIIVKLFEYLGNEIKKRWYF